MRIEQWQHPLTGTIYKDKSSYLEFMRDSKRDRDSLRRLNALRSSALDRLRGIYEVARFSEIEEFLNQHQRDVENACRVRHSNNGQGRISKPFKVELESENSIHWKAVFRWHYDFQHGSPDRWLTTSRRGKATDRLEYFSVDSIDDVLVALGMECQFGSGVEGRCRYNMRIPKDLFPCATVMEILAA